MSSKVTFVVILATLSLLLSCANAATWYVQSTGLSAPPCGTLPASPCRTLSALNATLLNNNDVIIITGTIEHPQFIQFSSQDWDKSLIFQGASSATIKMGASVNGTFFGTYSTVNPLRVFAFQNIAFTGATWGVFRGSTATNGWSASLVYFTFVLLRSKYILCTPTPA
jgi:hypothetical protein